MYDFEIQDVTIQRDGADLDVDHAYPKISEWISTYCGAGLVSVERGGTLGYLHCQAVMRFEQPMAAASISRRLNMDLGYKDKDSPQFDQGAVMTRALAQNKLHTFQGMVGYCMKD